MCFLITAVVEFFVVVQTGAIDLMMGRGGCLGEDHVWWLPRRTLEHAHICGLMSPSKQIRAWFMWKGFPLWCDGVWAGSALTISLFYLSQKQKPLHFNAPPPHPLCFSCLWTSALRASVSRHKPEGDTLSSILRYMVLNEERAAKETACLHINTLCDCSVPFQATKLLVTQWSFWCTIISPLTTLLSRCLLFALIKQKEKRCTPSL